MNNDNNDNEPKLYLDLDRFWEYDYFYTKYDIGHAGHSITIRASDKDVFIAAFKDEIGQRIEELLGPPEDDEDEDDEE